MSARVITITVHGTPAPQGSKRAYVRGGRAVLVESSNKVKPWRQDVKFAALEVLDGRPPMQGPVHARVEFYLPRPRGHYRTGRNAHLLRDAAPGKPDRKPDIDKLLRSTLDGLGEAGAWGDDSQVCEVVAAKRYADERPPGAVIVLTTAERSLPQSRAQEVGA